MTHNKKIMRESLYWIMGLGLFLLPLINAWMLYPLGIENFNTQYSALGGILPWSDAGGYYSGANTLLKDGSLDYWNTRRPLNAILFSIRLWLSNGNFQIALIIQALLCGLGCLLVTKSVTQRFGKLSGIATLFILFLFAAVFIPTTLSETLGLTLGCFGFVFLWEGVRTKRAWIFFWAGLILMVGLNARAGAFLALPLIILWLTYHFKEGRFPIAFILGLLVAFIFNLAIIKLYHAAGEGALHGNFSFTLFGFVSGGKIWTHAYTAYPEILAKSEADIAKFLYLKSYEMFKENPSLLLLGIFKNLGGLLKAFLQFFQSELPSNLLFKGSIRLLGMLFLGFWFWRLKKLYRINRKEIGLIIIVLVGMILSGSIIWRDGGFRVFAVTVPFFAAAFGVVVGSYRLPNFQIHSIDPKKIFLSWETKVAFVFSSLLLSLSLFSPLFIKTSQPINNAQFTCATNETAIIPQKIFGAPHINIASKTNQFRKTVLWGNREDKEAFLRILEPDILKKDMALGTIYDLNTKQLKYIMAPSDLFSNHNAIGLCAAPISNTKDMIYQVNSFGVLSEK